MPKAPSRTALIPASRPRNPVAAALMQRGSASRSHTQSRKAQRRQDKMQHQKDYPSAARYRSGLFVHLTCGFNRFMLKVESPFGLLEKSAG